jgi:mannose-6-phosphate isomerase-like protein (cupin superfamily)
LRHIYSAPYAFEVWKSLDCAGAPGDPEALYYWRPAYWRRRPGAPPSPPTGSEAVSGTPDAIPVTVTGEQVVIGGFAAAILATAEATGGAYEMVEHLLGPGLIGAAPHRHSREDEVSYVLDGTLTVWRDGVVTAAGPGAVVHKPRGEWHTFWNAGDVPVRFIELISPPGFAEYFRDLARLIPERGAPDPEAVVALAARYGMEMDLEGVGPLMERHGVRFG